MQTASCAPGLDGVIAILVQLRHSRVSQADTAACVEHGACRAAFAAGEGMRSFEPAFVFVAVFRGIL